VTAVTRCTAPRPSEIFAVCGVVSQLSIRAFRRVIVIPCRSGHVRQQGLVFFAGRGPRYRGIGPFRIDSSRCPGRARDMFLV